MSVGFNDIIAGLAAIGGMALICVLGWVAIGVFIYITRKFFDIIGTLFSNKSNNTYNIKEDACSVTNRNAEKINTSNKTDTLSKSTNDLGPLNDNEGNISKNQEYEQREIKVTSFNIESNNETKNDDNCYNEFVPTEIVEQGEENEFSRLCFSKKMADKWQTIAQDENLSRSNRHIALDLSNKVLNDNFIASSDDISKARYVLLLCRNIGYDFGEKVNKLIDDSGNYITEDEDYVEIEFDNETEEKNEFCRAKNMEELMTININNDNRRINDFSRDGNINQLKTELSKIIFKKNMHSFWTMILDINGLNPNQKRFVKKITIAIGLGQINFSAKETDFAIYILKSCRESYGCFYNNNVNKLLDCISSKDDIYHN